MSTSSHLPLLREMFPGKIFLGVKDIARCCNVSQGHIYNLSSAKRLPFKVEKSKTVGVGVSILAMAKYLDTLLDVEVTSTQVPVEAVPKRKPGRPRKNGGLTLFSFQSALSFELLAMEARDVMHEVVSMLSSDDTFRVHAAGADDLKALQVVLEVQARTLSSKMTSISQTLRPRFREDRKPDLGAD